METHSVRSESKIRRLIFGGGVAAVVVLILEVAAFFLFFVVDGRLFSYSRLERERRAIRAEPVSSEEGERTGDEPPPAGIQGIATQTIHPYVGFVYDPTAPPTKDLLTRHGWHLTRGGFVRKGEVPERAPDGTLSIAVFGGSVAMGFANYGDLLLSELRKLGMLPERGGVVLNYALPGYKQPQQLMTLSYLLVQRERFDIVINLDGFNELVLPYSENIRQGLNPLYPRGWPQRVASVPDLSTQRVTGEIVYLEDLRARRASLFSQAPLRYSVICNLLWRLQDRRLGIREVELNELLLATPDRTRSFSTLGPTFDGGDDPAILQDLAEVWARSSLLMNDVCAGEGIPYYHFLQPNQYVPGSKRLSGTEQREAFRENHYYRKPVVEGYGLLKAEGRY
ncbi:MAG: hypothetical protein AB1Z65_09330, partial [Candidatus Sulfomarinibacteraceae bacterium]